MSHSFRASAGGPERFTLLDPVTLWLLCKLCVFRAGNPFRKGIVTPFSKEQMPRKMRVCFVDDDARKIASEKEWRLLGGTDTIISN